MHPGPCPPDADAGAPPPLFPLQLYDAALPLAILAYWLHVKAYYSSHSDAFLLFQKDRRIKQDPFKLFQSRDGTKTD